MFLTAISMLAPIIQAPLLNTVEVLVSSSFESVVSKPTEPLLTQWIEKGTLDGSKGVAEFSLKNMEDVYTELLR